MSFCSVLSMPLHPSPATTTLAHNISLLSCSQEVIFDKTRGTVSLMNSRFLEKHILGYRRKSECANLCNNHLLCVLSVSQMTTLIRQESTVSSPCTCISGGVKIS